MSSTSHSTVSAEQDLLLIGPDDRPGLFAEPVQLPGPACPGDQLVAFLGRRPRPPAAPGRP
jgi:hypothetical protein